MSRGFARRVLDWHATHGRTDLPWQQPVSPYRVWVSEIMLQQTQVATVIPYFEAFVARFPDVASLAAAEVDAVLGLWSGLGYYARARNLHRAAQLIVQGHGGEFPERIDALRALPGIGRSTAGAVLSLSRNAAHPILDGNVKRVLARHDAIEGWPGKSAVAARLWQRAEALLPRDEPGRFNQAMMDLGATVCTRSRPRCAQCPVRTTCRAQAAGTVDRFPGRRARVPIPERETWMLLLRDHGQGVLLQRRSASGRWGGLWSFPEFDARAAALEWAAQRCGALAKVEELAPFRHTFSHFHLDIHPLLASPAAATGQVMEGAGCVWYNGGQRPGGLPRPVTRLLSELGFG